MMGSIYKRIQYSSKSFYRTAPPKGHFKKYFLFSLFLERGEGREEEKHQCVVASHVAPTGDFACNPGMCPDWESNGWPFGPQPVLNPLLHQPGQKGHFFNPSKMSSRNVILMHTGRVSGFSDFRGLQWVMLWWSIGNLDPLGARRWGDIGDALGYGLVEWNLWGRK